MVAFLGLAGFQLWSNTSGRQLSDHDYITGKWYKPIAKELELHTKRVSNGALLDRDFIVDAASSPDRIGFHPRLAKALDDYITAVDGYNRSALRFSNRVVEAMRANTLLSSAVGNLPGSGSSIVIHPLPVLDPKKDPEMQKVARNLATDPNINISVEIEMPRWSHVEFGMIGRRFANDTQRLIRGLHEIRIGLSQSDVAVEFSNARAAVVAAQARLKAELP